MQFFANLQKKSMEVFLSQNYQPNGWLLSTHRLTNQTKNLCLKLHEEGRPVFADNGTKRLIDIVMKRNKWRTFRINRIVRKISKRKSRSVHSEDIPKKLRERAIEIVRKVVRKCVRISENIDWQDLLMKQLSMKPTHLIAQEDFAVACLIGLRLEREITGLPLEFYIERNQRSLKLWKRVNKHPNCHRIKVYAVLSAVDYDTAFEAGKLAASEGVKYIAIGMAGIMLDLSTVDYYEIRGSKYSLDNPVRRSYVRFAQIIRGIDDGYRSLEITPDSFHILGLGAPTLFPVLVAALNEETHLSVDSTSPIHTVTKQNVLFDPEKNADRRSLLSIVESILMDKDWPFICPFCQNYRENHGHEPNKARKWWKNLGKPKIEKKHLKYGKPLSQMIPLFTEHKDSSEVLSCRIAHNHWVINDIIKKIPDGLERKEWAFGKINEMISYESTLIKHGLEATIQIIRKDSIQYPLLS